MKLLILLIIFISCSKLPYKRTDKLSILQGITNTKEVEFSVVAGKGKNLRFELRSAEGEIIAPDEVKIITRSYSEFEIYKFLFTRNPAIDYNLYAYQGTSIVDQRLIGRGQRDVSKLRLAIASGMNDSYQQHFKIWDTLASKNPEYLLMIGNNVFANGTSDEEIGPSSAESVWRRYLDARLSFPVFFQQKLIPTHAIWGERDYGQDESNRELASNNGREIFEAFYAQDISDDDWSKGQGTGGLLSLGDFNLYFLDARTFRSKKNPLSHLGLDQSAWLYSKIREEATPSLVIKGDQFFGGYHILESFEGQAPDEFLQFINELKQVNTPFVFLSGGRPISEIMQFPRSLFGKPSFEITTGPLHGLTEHEPEKNPWRVVSKNGQVSFTIIDNLASNNHWFLDVESIGENGESYFRRELAVYIKDLQNNLFEVRKRRSGRRHYRKLRMRKKRRNK